MEAFLTNCEYCFKIVNAKNGNEEVLIYVSVDTVKLNEATFKYVVSAKQDVKCSLI